MNKQFEKFIAFAGSQKNAADILGCTEAAISNIRKGKHGLSKERARAIIAILPNINLEELLFPEKDEAA